MKRDTVFLDPIDVPRQLADRGYTGTYVAERLVDELLALQRNSKTMRRGREIDSTASLVDLTIPGRFSMQAILRYAHRILRITEAHISGGITEEAHGFQLILRLRNQRVAAIIGTHLSDDVGTLLRFGADDIMGVVDPHLVAVRHYEREIGGPYEKTLAAIRAIVDEPRSRDRGWALGEGREHADRPGGRNRWRNTCGDRHRSRRPAGVPRLAALLRAMGLRVQAEGILQELLDRQGRTSDVLIAQASAANMLHHGPLAIERARRALQLDPSATRAYVEWANACQHEHRHADAVALLERAIAANPSTLHAQAKLAISLAELGRVDEALAAGITATKAYPHEQSLNGYGYALLAAARPEEAARSFAHAARLQASDADSSRGWGDALLAQRDHDAALAKYDEALFVDPQCARAHLGRGRALIALGQLADAERAISEAVGNDRGFAAAYTEWGKVLDLMGRSDEAQVKYRQASVVEH